MAQQRLFGAVQAAAIKENPQVLVNPLLFAEVFPGAVLLTGNRDILFPVQAPHGVQPRQKGVRRHPAVSPEHAGHQLHRQGVAVDGVDQGVQHLIRRSIKPPHDGPQLLLVQRSHLDLPLLFGAGGQHQADREAQQFFIGCLSRQVVKVLVGVVHVVNNQQVIPAVFAQHL